MAFERLPAIAATMVLLWGMTGPVPAEAAKLGPLTVSSEFGEPLRAAVDVVDVGVEVRPLAAELASPQTYAELGIAFPKSLEGATVRLVALPEARWAVSVSSLRSVDEPDFNLVLSLTTSIGRQLRHYRLAADAPASVAPPVPAPEAAVAAAAAPAPSSEPAVAVSPVPTPSVDPGQPMPTASVEASLPPPEGPRPSDTAPDATGAAAASGASDRGSDPLVATARAAPPAASATASITAHKRGTATPTAPATARDRLLLSGGGTGRATSRHGGRGSGAASKEIAFEAAMSEATARVRDLESIVADLRKLLDMLDKQIASAQAELAALQGGARSSDAMTAPMLPAPIGGATATLVRVHAKDAPLAPTVAGTPAPDPVIDPLMVGGALAVLVLLGVLLWRRRRQAARSAGPDTFMP
jgi:MYXO-CTERM domain-containing protein